RLVRRRLIVERTRRSRDRCRLLESQRAFLLLALGRIESACTQRALAIRKRAPFGKTLRQPRIVKRLQADALAPPLISNLTLDVPSRHRPRRVKHLARQEDNSRTGIGV